MNSFIKRYWVLFIVLAVFIFFKVPHLYYPYYWDESWPYAPAIKQLLHHGISLMPGAVEGELSRGHPLFFHAIAALWMKIFGDSLFAMHSFALTISILFLISIYEAGLRFFNQRVAVMGLMLVATQVAFFIQSSFVLFEMLVAFLAFLSICFYVKDKYVLTALCLTALFYTKESGLIVGFVLGIDSLVSAFRTSLPVKTRIYRLLSIGVPCILIGVFFMLQKQIMGWYIFPFYSGLIEHSWPAFWYKFRMTCIRVSFYEDFKYYYFDALMIMAIVAAIKNKTIRYLVVLLPFICMWYFVDDMRAGRLLPSIPFFIVFILVCGSFLFVYGSSRFFKHSYQRRLVILMGAFIVCFLCFSTMNFFTYRYLLATIVPGLFIAAVLFDLFIDRTYKMLYLPVIAVLLSISAYSFSQNNSYGDVDLGAFNGIEIQQGTINYLEQHNYYDKVIGTGSFLEQQHLTNQATGFLHSSKVFKNVNWEINANTEIAIFNNLEADQRYKSVKEDTSYQLVYRQTKGRDRGFVWAEIYMRRR